MSYYASSGEIFIGEDQLSSIADRVREIYGTDYPKVNDDDIFDDFGLVYGYADSYGFILRKNEHDYTLSFGYYEYRPDKVKWFFDSISKYVKAGTWVGFVGEDGATWEFFFTGESCYECASPNHIATGYMTENEGKTEWESYCGYLVEWAKTHRTEMHKGESPACFDEFVDFGLEDLNRGDD